VPLETTWASLCPRPGDTHRHFGRCDRLYTSRVQNCKGNGQEYSSGRQTTQPPQSEESRPKPTKARSGPLPAARARRPPRVELPGAPPVGEAGRKAGGGEGHESGSVAGGAGCGSRGCPRSPGGGRGGSAAAGKVQGRHAVQRPHARGVGRHANAPG